MLSKLSGPRFTFLTVQKDWLYIRDGSSNSNVIQCFSRLHIFEPLEPEVTIFGWELMVASLEVELHPQTVWEPLVDVGGTAVQVWHVTGGCRLIYFSFWSSLLRCNTTVWSQREIWGDRSIHLPAAPLLTSGEVVLWAQRSEKIIDSDGVVTLDHSVTIKTLTNTEECALRAARSPQREVSRRRSNTCQSGWTPHCSSTTTRCFCTCCFQNTNLLLRFSQITFLNKHKWAAWSAACKQLTVGHKHGWCTPRIQINRWGVDCSPGEAGTTRGGTSWVFPFQTHLNINCTCSNSSV